MTDQNSPIQHGLTGLLRTRQWQEYVEAVSAMKAYNQSQTDKSGEGLYPLLRTSSRKLEAFENTASRYGFTKDNLEEMYPQLDGRLQADMDELLKQTQPVRSR